VFSAEPSPIATEADKPSTPVYVAFHATVESAPVVPKFTYMR
jgi:hypothetical protein